MKDKKVANWLGGNQYELFAALTKNGMNPAQNKGVTIVHQPFDDGSLPEAAGRRGVGDDLQRARAGARDEEPEDREALPLSDLNVIKMPNVGTGMLEDDLFATGKWLKTSANQAIAVKFLAASLQGWIYCRDHQADCIELVLKNGRRWRRATRSGMMNEINKLVWPQPRAASAIDDNGRLRARRPTIAKTFGVIKKAPSGAYRTDLAAKASSSLKAARSGRERQQLEARSP